ncbi:MAG: MFS transporter [Acholeplasmataceae bacterium]|jgi:GPH family glycoside/pentoside/hexuronide:cation symporter/oligogalacturonide transporter|nr:MFS transporter [Acholeplasmataceae bacterium]
MTEKPFSQKEKLIFAWGDVFGGGSQAMIGVLYLIFLTDIIGINPALAATAILISKVWDAISDPLMGVISDNTRTRFGRRRPYIFFGGIFVMVSYLLMWFPMGSGIGELTKAIFAVSTYLFYSTIATVVMVPYSSLSAEITTDTKQRNSTNLIRLIISTASSAICTLVPTLILEQFKAGAFGIDVFYIVVGIGFGVFFALPLLLIGLFTRERGILPTEKSTFTFKTFAKPLKVKAFRGLVYMYLCQSISMDILSAGIIFFTTYVLITGSSTVFLGIFIGIQLLLFPLINYLVNKIDKKKIYYYGLPLAILSFLAVGLYPSNWPIFGAYVLTALTALGFAGAQLMSWIIFPDAVDAGELILGERPTGSFSGVMTFIRKTSSAIAIWIFGIMLALSGYVKPTDLNPTPIQPTSAVWGIRLSMTLSFAILMTIGYIVSRRFVLTKKLSDDISILLEKQEKQETLNDQESLRKKEIESLIR